ncbi:MAG: LacI family DNA-binding transcriptional regulator [Halioglobus sp.]
MKATIKDVAKLAGTSFKTVSRVINHENTVGEKLSARVWAAAKELNYQPNISARQMRGGASFIAYIYDNPNSHYVIEMQNGILQECHNQGYELLIHPIDFKSSNAVTELERLVSSSHIAGLVLTPPFSESAELIDLLLSRKMNFARIVSGSSAPDTLGPCVFIDDCKAAYAITDYLIKQGHRRIAYLGSAETDPSSVERLKGYTAALADHGISNEETLVLPGEYNFDSGAERTNILLSADTPPTAIFACNDEIAAGALFAARIKQVAVPEQLSIAGFEDSPFSRQSWPKLTTAHQSNTEIAATATRNLVQAIRASRQEETEDAELQTGFVPKLVIRESTCQAPE